MQEDPTENLESIVEAALLASGQALSIAQIGALFDQEKPPTSAQIAAVLRKLGEQCSGRGVELVEVASGWRYQVRSQFHPWVNRLWADRQARYSRALLETLALIAYRQPVTRGEIEQVRGVAVSTSIVRTLEEREWIRVVGYRDVPGKPALYGTTKEFLDYFQLKSLDQLPSLAEIRDLENFDPELEFSERDKPVPAQVAHQQPEADAIEDAASFDPPQSEQESSDQTDKIAPAPGKHAVHDADEETRA